MSRVTLGDGCAAAFRLDGPVDAPVLMMSNSLGTAMAMWDPQITALTRHYRILRYDTRGHGLSDAPMGAYSLDRLGRDAVELLDALGHKRVHFCGLSLGGMIGQWLAVHAPGRIHRLILANTSAYMGPPASWQARIESVACDGMGKLADASVGRWFTPGFMVQAPEKVARIRELLLATAPHGYAGACAAIRDMDMRPVASLNATPTLVLAGTFDPATPVADAEFLANQACAARLVTLEAAHLSNVEQADAFSAEVLGFLREN